MIKVADAFQHGKAFIAFITCGDPDIETTEKVILAAAESGADLIELGIPFSDPIAEGVVIQEADLRSLQGGTTTDDIFDMVRRIRSKIQIPLVFMTYANVVYSYGTEKFCEKAQEIGMNGLILPDVPYEEKAEFDGICKVHNLDLISLVAPTSHERICEIAKNASGFLYIVSSMGVTGVRQTITTDIDAMVKLVRESSDIPCAIGFGISTPEQCREMADKADGAIVGSAIIRIIAKYGRDCVPYVAAYIREMKDAIREEA